MMHHRTIDSPLGPLLLVGHDDGLTRIVFQSGAGRIQPDPQWQADRSLLDDAAQQLTQYFDGTRRQFSLALQPNGTPFQQQVWQALLQIPHGQTISYGELAQRIGRPTAARAVGAANGANRLPIVVPCHRVIGASGRLTGYYGGIDLKRGLLALEGHAATWQLDSETSNRHH